MAPPHVQKVIAYHFLDAAEPRLKQEGAAPSTNNHLSAAPGLSRTSAGQREGGLERRLQRKGRISNADGKDPCRPHLYICIFCGGMATFTTMVTVVSKFAILVHLNGRGSIFADC